MAKRKVNKTEGHHLSGAELTVDSEINFVSTFNPEISSEGGNFLWKAITGSITAWVLRDDTKGQDVLILDTVNDTLTINAPYTAIGFAGSAVSSSVTTADAVTVTEIDKIDTLTAESTHLIEVKLTCKSVDDTRYGIWYFILAVTKFNGTVVIENSDIISHDSSAGLNTNKVTFTVNGGDVDIDVAGVAATNIQWNCQYNIVQKSTN